MRFVQTLNLAIVAIAVLFVASCSGGSPDTMRLTSAVQTVTVSQLANNGWGIYDDNAETFRGLVASDFVSGPDTPPLGDESVEIGVTGAERKLLSTYQFGGTLLANITQLGYSTYNSSVGSSSATNAGYLNVNIDFTGSNAWQKRLIFVPRNNGTVIQDTWQAWDAINGGNALWGWSGGNTWPDGYVGATRTWSSILAAFPNARIRATDSLVGIKVGEGNTAFTENIDAFVFGTGGNTTTFNFDFTTKEDCKNGGWQSLGFSNQGQCVAAHNHQ
jgi:hypothetical protein